jgi:uncharacterized protein YggU (UPF0235/DUF167 family)
VDAPAALRRSATGVLLDVRAMPRAPRTAVGGVRSGRLLVRVTAAPVDDAANDAVVRALAEALDLPRGCIRIAAGAASRNKTIEITASDVGALRRRLVALL